ncbi:MAG: neutral/alkaline non-lysosomal ceramidase N-terminal domain-containing protein [Acidobacteria bacterium]|nr:neutral/alkaline non-lysosomal ceramidase N-terminal domain-containing protein [Acidobacteriota bacterium]
MTNFPNPRSRFIPSFFVAVIVLTFISGSASAAWKAGAAKVDITPSEPIWLAGYGSRDRPVSDVLQRIYVKALALQDDSGRVSVLVTSDLLGFTAGLSKGVAERVEKKHGIARAGLAFNASHTHSAPVVGELLRPAYGLGPAHVAPIKRYTEKLEDQVVDVIDKAIGKLKPATLSYEQGLAGFAVNRRRAGRGTKHYPSPVDHDVPVLAVKDSAGKVTAVVFGYACHATVLSGYEISGDWPGWAQEGVESLYPGAVGLFVQGCGADANPLPRRTVELAKRYGATLADAVDQVVKGTMQKVEGNLRVALEHVPLPFQTPPTKEELQWRIKTETSESRKRHAEYILEKLDRDGKLATEYSYPLQVWQFGDDITFIVMAGEVVVDYSLRFKKTYGWNNTWVAGYSNDVFAYIPSERVLHEGGYEGGGAMIPYGQPRPFKAGVEEIIANKVDELVQRVNGQP